MSALPPEADIRQRIEHVCFVPKADIRENRVNLPVIALYESGEHQFQPASCG
jgi:hypothetical protein